MSLEYIINALKNINVYQEVCKAEIETAIDDIYNDELYNDEETQKKLTDLTDEDINRLAWKLNDMDIWDEIYSYARELIYEEINVCDND